MYCLGDNTDIGGDSWLTQGKPGEELKKKAELLGRITVGRPPAFFGWEMARRGWWKLREVL
jgi:hypothetical protein